MHQFLIMHIERETVKEVSNIRKQSCDSEGCVSSGLDVTLIRYQGNSDSF